MRAALVASGAVALLLALAIVWFWAIFSAPIAWQLNLIAQTEIVRLAMPDNTRWDIGAGRVCGQARARPGSDAAPASAVERRTDGVTFQGCGSARWEALNSPVHELGYWLELPANPLGPISATFESRTDGGVELSLRAAAGVERLGHLQSFGDEKRIELPSAINIIWDPAPQASGSRTIVLPFSARLTVGRDVGWSSRHMLTSGRLDIFAPSDESLAGRTLAEDATLVAGDQVTLLSQPDAENVVRWPKGFVRFSPVFVGLPSTMEVVAFAPAEGMTIERFGGGTYRFEAGWWAKIRHQSALVILAILITGALSILGSLASVLGAYPILRDWWAACTGRGRA